VVRAVRVLDVARVERDLGVEMDTATVVQVLEVESPARAVMDTDQVVDLPRVVRAVADTDQAVDLPRVVRAVADTDQAVDLRSHPRDMDMDQVVDLLSHPRDMDMVVDQEVPSHPRDMDMDQAVDLPSHPRDMDMVVDQEVPSHPRASTVIQVDTNITTDQFVILRLMNKKSKMHHRQYKRATCVGERQRSRYFPDDLPLHPS